MARQAAPPKTRTEPLDNPLIRKITPGDLANPAFQGLIAQLVNDALPEPLGEAEIIMALNAGSLEAFWILSPDGEQAGLVTTQTGYAAEYKRRILYIATLTVAPSISPDGWMALFAHGRRLAKERGCALLEWDTAPNNTRVLDYSRIAGAKERVRFTLEVT